MIASVVWFLPGAGIDVLQPYQTARLTGFTNPDSDPSGATYNVTQSITAVGSGGLNGRGVEGATQTRLDYLPEHHTDFVFAALAEQRGFFGAALLLGLYLLVVWRGLRVIAVARDAFSAIVAGGIVIAFLFQVFVNVGMTMGIAPVTGIPLPFVTVGGSSMVANLIAIGVLQSIHARGHQGRAPRRADGRQAEPDGPLGPREGTADRRRRHAAAGHQRPARSTAREGALAAAPPRAQCASTAGRRTRRCSCGCSPALRLPRTSRLLRAAERADVPVVGVQTGTEVFDIPYVLATEVVMCSPGSGFPVEEIARAIARTARRVRYRARREAAGACASR